MSKYSEKLKQAIKVGDTVSVPADLGYTKSSSKERITGVVDSISDDREHISINMLQGVDKGKVVLYNIQWVKLELKK